MDTIRDFTTSTTVLPFSIKRPGQDQNKMRHKQGSLQDTVTSIRGRGTQPRKRRVRRAGYRFRVFSHQLPGFQAEAVDFSPLGLRIELDSPVEIHSILALLADFQWPGMESTTIQLHGKVVWCQYGGNRYQVGIEFLRIGDHTEELLRACYREVSSGLRSGVPAAAAKRHSRLHTMSQESNSAQSFPIKIRRAHGCLEAYSIKGDQLRVSLTSESGRDTWVFSDLRFLRDQRGLSGLEVVATWEICESPELSLAKSIGGRALKQEPLKHIKFVSRNEIVILELVAALSECYRERSQP